MENLALRRAATILGSRSRIAALCGVSKQNAYQWDRGQRPIPPKHALTIQIATKGAVTCEELHPGCFRIKDAA